MINKIWGIFIVSGIIFFIFTGNLDSLNNTIFESAKSSLDMCIRIFPVMALWLGIMNIARTSGLLNKLSKKFSKVIGLIFKEIPRDHESISLIASNIIANLFGLGNAATPFGLKAMKSMQELNNNSEVASNSMITFLIINTTGMTLIPTTIISMRTLYNSNNPSGIVLPCIIASFLSTILGLIIDRLMRRKND